MRTRELELGADRLETAALRYALARRGTRSRPSGDEVTRELQELEAAALAYLDLHQQETPPSCIPADPTSEQ